MAHRKYATECVVLGAGYVNDADAYLYLFTKSFGYIVAYAAGIRKLSSKLRYGLQRFSYVEVELVRGRNLWKVTGARPIYVPAGILGDEKKMKTAAHTTLFLKRFFVGEDTHNPLFDGFVEGVLFLDRTPLGGSELRLFELLMMVRILFHLGYLRTGKVSDNIIGCRWDAALLSLVERNEEALRAAVNHAIEHSHL